MALQDRSLSELPLTDDSSSDVMALFAVDDGSVDAAALAALTPAVPPSAEDGDEERELLELLGLQDDDKPADAPSDDGDGGIAGGNDDDDDHSLLQLLCLHDEDALQIESESERSSGDDANPSEESPLECRDEAVSDADADSSATNAPSGVDEDEDAVSQSQQHKPNATTKGKPRRNRKRPKQEMDALRIEEKELSDKLLQLQEQLQRQQDALVASSREGSLVVKIAVNKESGCSVVAPGGESGITSNQPPSTLLPSSAGVWQSLAWFQREDVRAAITENTRLRTLFQHQLQILSRLDAMYHQFSSVTELAALQLDYGDCGGGTAGAAALTKRARVDPFDDDFAIFASLGLDFDAQYLKTESIFESTGLASFDGRLRQEMLPKRGANGIYFLESLHSKTIPHDMYAHDAMTWSVLASEDLHAHHGAYEVRELTHDLVCRKIVNKIRLPLGESTLIRRTALKRYIEEDRVVVIWDAVLEVTGSVSMRLRERGWKILRRPHVIPAEHKDSEPTTVEQWCVRVTPELSTTYSEEDIAVGSLTNAIVAAYRRHLKLMHHMDRNVFAAQFKKALDTLASRLNS